MTRQLREVCDRIVKHWEYPVTSKQPVDDLWKYYGVILRDFNGLVSIGLDNFNSGFLEKGVDFPDARLVVLGEGNSAGFNFGVIRPSIFPQLQLVVVLSPPGEYTWGGFPPTLQIAVDKAYARAFSAWPRDSLHVFDGARDGDPARLAGLLHQYLQ